MVKYNYSTKNSRKFISRGVFRYDEQGVPVGQHETHTACKEKSRAKGSHLEIE